MTTPPRDAGYWRIVTAAICSPPTALATLAREADVTVSELIEDARDLQRYRVESAEAPTAQLDALRLGEMGRVMRADRRMREAFALEALLIAKGYEPADYEFVRPLPLRHAQQPLPASPAAPSRATSAPRQSGITSPQESEP